MWEAARLPWQSCDGMATADESPASRERSRADVEREVLAILGGPRAELGGGRARGQVTLRDGLERDLGLGSLARVELLVRLEEAFGVRLPDRVMAEAECARDLMAALLAGAAAPAERVPERAKPVLPGVAAPATTQTLDEALRWHAERDPERLTVSVRDDDETEHAISYRRLWRRAPAIGAGLVGRGLEPGERVALMYRFDGGASDPVRRVVVGPDFVKIKTVAVDLPLATTHGAVAVRLVGYFGGPQDGIAIRVYVRFEGPDVVKKDQPGRFLASNAPPGTLVDCSDESLGISSPSGAFLD